MLVNILCKELKDKKNKNLTSSFSSIIISTTYSYNSWKKYISQHLTTNLEAQLFRRFR